MKRFFQFFRDDGFTQVSVLLGIALAFVLIAMMSLGPRLLRSAAPAHPVSDIPLQEALQDSLRSFVRTKLIHPHVPCGDPAEFYQSHLYLRTYKGTVGQMKADPPAGLSARAWDELFQGSMAANSFAGAALSRCPLTVLGTGGRFHFCLQVQRDARAPKESFLSAPLVFVEVSIQLADRKSGQTLSCSQYLEPTRTSAGAVVEYLLFAVSEKDEALIVSKKRSSFTLGR